MEILLTSLLSQKEVGESHPKRVGSSLASFSPCIAASNCRIYEIVTISEIMTAQLVSVSPDQSAREIVTLFRTRGIQHVLVKEQGQLVGIISGRDIVAHLTPFIRKLFQTETEVDLPRLTAHQIMRRDPPTADITSSIREVALMMLKTDAYCIPIVNRSEIVGVVTTHDIIGHLAQRMLPIDRELLESEEPIDSQDLSLVTP